MARCLRCNAGNEWIEGRVPDEPTEHDGRVTDLETVLRDLLNHVGQTPTDTRSLREVTEAARDVLAYRNTAADKHSVFEPRDMKATIEQGKWTPEKPEPDGFCPTCGTSMMATFHPKHEART